MNQAERRKTLIQLLRALLNIRVPMPAVPEPLRLQHDYLQAELAQKPVTGGDAQPEIRPRICLCPDDETICQHLFCAAD